MGRNGRTWTTSSLVSLGGLVVAMVTGAGLWVGHEQSATSTDTGTSSSGTSSSTDTGTSSSGTGSSTESGTSSDSSSSSTGVTQGSQNSSSDATTTGS